MRVWPIVISLALATLEAAHAQTPPTTSVTLRARHATKWRVHSYELSAVAAGLVLQIRAQLLAANGGALGVYDKARRYAHPGYDNLFAMDNHWTLQREVLAWGSETLDLTTNHTTGESDIVFDGREVGRTGADSAANPRVARFIRDHEHLFVILDAVRLDLDAVALVAGAVTAPTINGRSDVSNVSVRVRGTARSLRSLVAV